MAAEGDDGGEGNDNEGDGAIRDEEAGASY